MLELVNNIVRAVISTANPEWLKTFDDAKARRLSAAMLYQLKNPSLRLGEGYLFSDSLTARTLPEQLTELNNSLCLSVNLWARCFEAEDTAETEILQKFAIRQANAIGQLLAQKDKQYSEEQERQNARYIIDRQRAYRAKIRAEKWQGVRDDQP